ncbi:transposase [Amaricoccus solimangrovi]|uniref:Transposase n=1 Tax=Amaricoccus solimangrovi TaxID=2589815 RepID=A0A501WMW6_9RHOB|nr:transposase [Amaricoccus solimangrovi]
MGQQMKRRTFSREFKVEAGRLVTERGVAVAQACRELELSESVPRRWMREFDGARRARFPGLAVQAPSRPRSLPCGRRSPVSRRSVTS